MPREDVGWDNDFDRDFERDPPEPPEREFEPHGPPEPPDHDRGEVDSPGHDEPYGPPAPEPDASDGGRLLLRFHQTAPFEPIPLTPIQLTVIPRIRMDPIHLRVALKL